MSLPVSDLIDLAALTESIDGDLADGSGNRIGNGPALSMLVSQFDSMLSQQAWQGILQGLESR